MRVLMPLGEPLLPGKARFVAIVNTAAALARAGLDVRLMLPGRPDAVARWASGDLGLALPPRLSVVRLAGWHRALGHPLTWGFVTTSAALRAVRRARGDRGTLVHVRHEKLADALARRREDVPPFVFEAHALSADYERECGRSARRVARADARTRRILGGAAGVAAITAGLRDSLVSRYGFGGPSVVARSGIDLARFPRSWSGGRGAQAGAPRVAYVGRLGAWKAVGALVDAVARIPSARLVLVGAGDDGDAERLRARALAAGAGDRVELRGRIPHREVAAALADADVAVHALPADLSIAARDTSPLKLLEYLAVGVPVVAPDLPSIREIVTDGESAVLFPPGVPGAIEAALRRVLADPALQRRLSDAGRAIAERHDWDARARILAGLYEKALA
jgi:glycosyltransferase involved in cell wall biosynthesis